MSYSEDDYLNLAGIQHFVFCRRQWALIHIENQWSENVRTALGKVFHETAHEGMGRELRGNTLIVRGMPVHSHELGINGVCDVVEFKRDNKGIELYGVEGKWRCEPIEYKRGKPKDDGCDIMQTAAQALCLEEMLETRIERCCLYYGETRHRQSIELTDELRAELKSITEEMHEYYTRGYTPKVKTSKKCNACSLKEICMPVLCRKRSARAYIDAKMQEGDEE